jgi:hypothetical protein
LARGLFLKLLENKIDGHFYNLIKSLYSNSKCAVKESKINRAEFFFYSKGVRPGCILSPLLFNIYINELATLFDNTAADPFILPNGTKLSCLLYADDLILLSRSKIRPTKISRRSPLLEKKWLMEINLKKTQMIFEKRKTRKARPIFNLGNRKIKIVQEYCYLGVKLNHNGNFTLALKQLSEKALHALYGIRRQLNFSYLNPKYAIKIFDSIITPILYYTTRKYGGHT